MGTIILGTTAVATKTATDPRTIGTQIDDSSISIRVSYAINTNKQLKNQTRIINVSYQGKVLLIGQAPTRALIRKAKHILTNINGVTDIYNEIRLGQPIRFKQILMDTWITTKIRLRLLIEHRIHPYKIKIITENREVFLLGLIKTYTEGKLAAKTASKINEVKHVITIFSYI